MFVLLSSLPSMPDAIPDPNSFSTNIWEMNQSINQTFTSLKPALRKFINTGVQCVLARPLPHASAFSPAWPLFPQESQGASWLSGCPHMVKVPPPWFQSTSVGSLLQCGEAPFSTCFLAPHVPYVSCWSRRHLPQPRLL